mgnify:CR=1 FL=1
MDIPLRTLMELIDELHRELKDESNPDEMTKILDLIDQYRALRDRVLGAISKRGTDKSLLMDARHVANR